MPVFRLDKRLLFPPPDMAEADGLLAVGGDLSPQRLLLAYSMGIFPWFDEPPILWWSPDPRVIIEPHKLKISRRLARTLRSGRFTVTIDRAFAEVIRLCAGVPRAGQSGTWITPAMEDAYVRLFQRGFAHSVECWRGTKLAGGIYGVSLGRCFFGESMFHRETDASKVALAGLMDHLRRRGFAFLDCQLPSSHLASLGAIEISRRDFLLRMKKGEVAPGIPSSPSPF
ncbi:MAG: leucyl/phenylalanyl-tRNA--protein transferase [Deltaproteobacteria bacterium]|nr:leucyl/phenylalanyl-tRNA--protein transferase [Deltaproteobacteria bacterium]